MRHFNHILFIDDDEASNFYHEYILKNCSFINKTNSFTSPSKALKYFKNLNEQQNKLPDIVFLDINMPEINGFDFLDKLESFNLENYPPIMLLTTSVNPIDKNRAKVHPLVYDFINKPLTIQHLEKLRNEL